ncbi:MAG: uroporphyrinogen-III synthase [Sphingomonadales bacterium]|nr:uroporphyrinogen-III synthase [Sphingomonadales bacterium]
MHILLTRPEISSKSTAAQLIEMGHSVEIYPLLEIVSLPSQKLDQTFEQTYGAIVFTSQNAVREFEKNNPNVLSAFTGKVFAVGRRTTQAIFVAGNSNVIQGSGDVDGLAMVVADNMVGVAGKILFPRGKHVRGNLDALLAQQGFDVVSEVIYEAKAATELPKSVVNDLKLGKFNCVLFYSARTATTFIELALAEKIKALPQTSAVALSEYIGRGLEGLGWNSVYVAEEKTEQALFDCIKDDMVK